MVLLVLEVVEVLVVLEVLVGVARSLAAVYSTRLSSVYCSVCLFDCLIIFIIIFSHIDLFIYLHIIYTLKYKINLNDKQM